MDYFGHLLPANPNATLMGLMFSRLTTLLNWMLQNKFVWSVPPTLELTPELVCYICGKKSKNSAALATHRIYHSLDHQERARAWEFSADLVTIEDVVVEFTALWLKRKILVCDKFGIKVAHGFSHLSPDQGKSMAASPPIFIKLANDHFDALLPKSEHKKGLADVWYSISNNALDNYISGTCIQKIIAATHP